MMRGGFNPADPRTQQMAAGYQQRLDSGQNLMTRGPESLAHQQVYGGTPAGKPGQAQSQQSPYATSTPYGAYNPNIANNPQAPRPPAFQASYGQPDGSFSSQPNFGQRDAFIQNLNQQAGMQTGGMPQFNFGQAWNQAGNMVQQGWQNPFAPQNPFAGQMAVPGGMPDPGGNIRDLIQGPQPGKPEPTSPYPASWGEPPAVQTRDIVPLPGGGYGSSTERNWIIANMNGQAQPAQDPYGSSTPYPQRPYADPPQMISEPYPQPVAPPTAEQFRQQQSEIKQKGAVNDLYSRAKVQPGASTDELVLGLINNTPGGTLVRPEALAGLPEEIRGAVSRYQDLAGLAQSLSRPTTQAAWQRQQDVNAALTQLKGRITERAQASQALQRDYGMSPADAAAWVNREMPMPDQAATMQGLQQKQGVYEEQERAVNQEKVRASWKSPEYLERRLKELQQDLTDTNRGKAVPGVPRTAAQIQKEIQQAQQALRDSKAKESPATAQWNRIKATTNTQTKPLSPAHQRVYQAMLDEQWKSSGRGETWMPSGSPLADMARARNARTGQGITGMEPRKR
jgi:hypothetical protein